jgi:predicted pyridoxine 5'-phosphate oxidase superfamily flavin-nucleotide-binding protein
MHAYAHHSHEEAVCALRALDFATDQMSDHVEHALRSIDAERAS